MKPWKVTRTRGACVGLLAFALVAAPARADDGVTLTRFKLGSIESSCPKPG